MPIIIRQRQIWFLLSKNNCFRLFFGFLDMDRLLKFDYHCRILEPTPLGLIKTAFYKQIYVLMEEYILTKQRLYLGAANGDLP